MHALWFLFRTISDIFSEKRLGYWAASQCFDEGTDVLMLTTNLIKKDILKGSEWESGLALGGLACFMTPDLGLFLLLISAKTVVILLLPPKVFRSAKVKTVWKPRTWPMILFRLWVQRGLMSESELFWFLTNYFFIILKAIIYDHLKTIIFNFIL